MMADGNFYVLLDVRTAAEYEKQYIEGAILIPYDEIKKRAGAELPDKNGRLLIYCRSGIRSATAARTLVDLGYAEVYDMGGIISWPYDTISKWRNDHVK